MRTRRKMSLSIFGITHPSQTTRPAWAGTASKPILRQAMAARHHVRLHHERVPVSKGLVDRRPLRAPLSQIFPPHRCETAPRGARVLSPVVGNESTIFAFLGLVSPASVRALCNCRRIGRRICCETCNGTTDAARQRHMIYDFETSDCNSKWSKLKG